MDKKLLDKLSGFNLSMQQKMQLVELIQEAGEGASNEGGDDEKIVMTMHFDNKKVYYQDIEYNVVFDISANIIDVANKELHKIMLEHVESNSIIDMILLDINVKFKSRVISRGKDLITGKPFFTVAVGNVINEFYFIE